MKEDALRVNQLIEVEMDYNGKRVVLSSRIEAIEEEYLLIATPIRQGIPLLISPGTNIVVQFRWRDTLFAFNSEVVSRRLRPIPVWIIKKPVEFFRIAQKRSCVRLAINLPLRFQYLDRNDETIYKGLTVDISAGGILFSSTQACNAGEKIKVELSLTENSKVSSVAQVVRAFDKKEGALRGYRVAVEFEDITEIERDRIFKFVFDKQREWIRKGLLE